MSDTKNIKLTKEETKLIIDSFDTCIVYLENCKSRFKLLDMQFYFKDIDKGIYKIIKSREKFVKLSNKFEDKIDSPDDILSTFRMLADSYNDC